MRFQKLLGKEEEQCPKNVSRIGLPVLELILVFGTEDR